MKSRALPEQLGSLWPSKSSMYVRMAADSTMLRMVNRLIALSFGVHREQLEHLMGLTWPRPASSQVSGFQAILIRNRIIDILPFLLRPLFFLFLTILSMS
jgi:hypothetical protein